MLDEKKTTLNGLRTRILFLYFLIPASLGWDIQALMTIRGCRRPAKNNKVLRLEYY